MWTESQERLPKYLLIGGSGPNVVHACNFFFFFWISTRHAYQRSWQNEDFSRAFQRTNDLEFWTCFPEVQGILDVLPKGPIDLMFGHAFQRSNRFEFIRASQRSDRFEIWTCFPKVQWIWIWTCFLEVRWICGRWYLCQCVWVLYPSSCKINIFN